MSKELKPCPFCGGELMFCPSHVEGQYIINKPGGVCKKCGMRYIGLGYRVYGEVKSEDFNDEKFFERWNTRPAEDAMKAEVEELRYIVEQFRSWYNENGCPKRLNPDFPCSAETEYNNDPETDGNFYEYDCWKEEHEHSCWVEYYRWKYRQKNNNPDTAKGGEDE